MSSGIWIRPNPVLERWTRDHADAGHYAGFAGFSSDIRKGKSSCDPQYSDGLQLAYDDMDIYTKIDLYGLVLDLMDEARGKLRYQRPAIKKKRVTEW